MTEHEMKMNIDTMQVQCSCGQSFDPFDAVMHQEEVEKDV